MDIESLLLSLDCRRGDLDVVVDLLIQLFNNQQHEINQLKKAIKDLESNS